MLTAMYIAQTGSQLAPLDVSMCPVGLLLVLQACKSWQGAVVMML